MEKGEVFLLGYVYVEFKVEVWVVKLNLIYCNKF